MKGRYVGEAVHVGGCDRAWDAETVAEAVMGPAGTVTFLFTDIEGSTGAWEADERVMAAALALHDEVVRGVIDGVGGYVFSRAGDSFAVAFARADAGVLAAVETQRRLAAADWPAPAALRVRMGLCTGEAHERDGDYFGLAVNRAARVMGAAHGGQVLVADATRLVVEDHLPAGVEVRDLGPHRLRGLARAEHLWQVVAEGLQGEFAPLATEVVDGNLPSPPTSFLGRSDEVEEVRDLVGSCRFVTLTGVGGTGKTRLAIEVAAGLGKRFPDGRWWCELGAVDDPAAVPAQVAEALVVPAQPGRSTTQAIVDTFRAKRALLVVDNCEHVLDEMAELVEAIVTGCGDVAILATSREPLRCAGEQVWSVPPLDPEAAGVELFVARARSAEAHFDADDTASIVELCRRLDGLPLAIELAAARARTLTPRELVDRLDDRFRLLRDAGRRSIDRHQTLATVLDWSYRLLDDDGRALFDRLAVFAGGFDLAAAEAVCGGDGIDHTDVTDLMSSLVDRSLVVADHRHSATRFRLLETVRVYAENRLDADVLDHFRQRHLHHYIDVAARADELFTGTGWWEGSATFEAEWDNLRSALNWALSRQDLHAATEIVRQTSWFAQLKARTEHERWARQVVDLVTDLAVDPPPAAAGVAACWANFMGRGEDVEPLAKAGIAAASTPNAPSTNWCWQALTHRVAWSEDHAGYEQALEAWAHASAEPSDRFHAALRAGYRAIAGTDEQLAEAVTAAEEFARACPNPSLRIWVDWAAANSARARGRHEQALDGYRRCLDRAEEADHRIMEASAAVLAVVELAEIAGPFDPLEHLRYLEIFDRHRIHLEPGLWFLARHLYSEGHHEQAAIIAGHLIARVAVSFDDEFESVVASTKGSGEWLAYGATLNTDEIIDHTTATLNSLAASDAPTAR